MPNFKFRALAFLTLFAVSPLASAKATLEARQMNNTDGSPAPAQVFINGEITAGISQQLGTALGRHRIESATIYLNSAGGDLHAAMELGEFIREIGFNTAVGKRDGEQIAAGSCNSACLAVLAGGTFRYANERDHLGIHRFYSTETRPTDLATGQIISASLSSHFSKMGVDPALFGRMVGAGADIRKLTVAESVQLRLLNQGKNEPVWEVQGKSGRIYLSGHQKTDRGHAAIQISCDLGAQTDLRAEFSAAQVKHRGTSVGQAVLANGNYMPSQANTAKASGSTLTADFKLTSSQAEQLKNASSLGFAWFFSGGLDPVEFSIPSSADRELISSFLSHCQRR